MLTHQLIELSTYWLLADKTHMSNRCKQNSSCSDIVSYEGLRVPSEWRQSFLMWSTSFNLCVQYWRTKYNREDIALRRTNVWSHTLPDGTLSDVGVKNEDLAEQAITDSKANGDHRYFDNPYIKSQQLPEVGCYRIWLQVIRGVERKENERERI